MASVVESQKEKELAPPMDLSHHISRVTRNRVASKIKDFYKYFAIPGIGNLAGGTREYICVFKIKLTLP
jgi:hypothetical protein